MTISRITTVLASQAHSVSNAKSRHLSRFALALCTALTPVWAISDTLPTGGTVVHGTAQISTPTPGAMTINQSSDRAVVNWDGFSIGQGNRVDINQPGASSAILNRVTGDTTSQIHGQLNANGRVFVVNPNGIFIGPSGSVNSGGFVASTLNIRTDDFVTGKTVFEGNGASATVENAGNIQVVTGGYAALIGGKVKNSGTIQAPLGFVGLGSGERVTLDLAGDGFLQVAVPTNSEDDGLEALIENSGTIQANGGTVQISAATARNAARHAINMSGVVEARTVSGRNGRITLGGGSGGKVTVSGKVRTRTRPAIQVTESVRPALRPERGGDITITGREITLAGAEIDASGTNGGGDIRIGGEYQGGAGLPTAQTLTVDAATTINADGNTAGDGGRIILWSDVDTAFAGSISARGGAEAGAGGFVEVSGKQNLAYMGLTDVRAPNGPWGDLLLDPADVEIVASAPGTNQILNSDLVTQLGLSNVTVATDGSGDLPVPFSDLSEPGTITVDAPVVWTTAGNLFLSADADINVNEAISSQAGSIDLSAVGSVTVDNAISSTTGQIRLSGSSVNLNDDITTTAGEQLFISSGLINVGSGTTASVISTVSGDIVFDAGTEVQMFPGSSLSSTSGEVSISAQENIVTETITTDNDVFLFAGLDGIARSFDLFIAEQITSNSGDISIETENGIEIDAPLSAPNGTIAIDAAGAFAEVLPTDTDSTINASEFNLIAGDWIQIEPVLPAFDTDNFIIGTGASFLRATGGDGMSMANAYTINDVYGLQGIGTLPVPYNFALEDDIDASSTLTWISPLAAPNGTRDAGFVPYNYAGILQGNRFTISNLYMRRHVETPGTSDAGLFAALDGSVQDLRFTGLDIAGQDVGAVAALNGGTISGVEVSGDIQVYGDTGGGIAGTNDDGLIISSRTNVDIIDAFDPSISSPGGERSVTIGGIVGANVGAGQVDRVRSSGTISAAAFNDIALVGGIAGLIDGGFVSNSYSTGTTSVFAVDGSFANVGGISGQNRSLILNTLSNGPVSLGGAGGNVGAITGSDDDSTASIISSYFNPETTGQTDSGALGEGPTQVRSRTTAQLQNALDFYLEANGAGWDFDAIWSLPQDGSDQTRLYSVDPVISAFGQLPPPSFEYNGSTTGFTAFGTYAGGTNIFLFGPDGDTGDVTVLGDQITLSDPNVGIVSYRFPTDFTSDLGQAYDVRSLDWPAQVTPAPLTVTVGDVDKIYGTELDPGSAGVTAETLLGSDTITNVTVTSTGSPADTPVSNETYPILVETIEGTGLGNYSISFIPGQLRVVPRTLNVEIDDATKVYGEEIVFDGTEFTVIGLINEDTLTTLTIKSEGQPAEAPVADSPYLIDADNPVGTGLSNYVLNVIPGELTVMPAPLTITADDQTKPFGTEFIFEGTEFTVTGLLNDDRVDSATLSSDAAAADAPMTEGPGVVILITDPEGEGLDNYEITLVNGLMIVAPGNLTITANDQTKVYGTEFTFDGTEFTVVGLAEGDSVDSVTLTSAGTAGTAQVTDGPFAIIASDATGTGLDNYTLVFADGSFTVVPAPLTVTADDQIKQQGQEFTFTGTEFTTAGLLNADSVDSAVLSSDGAAADAQTEDSPFAIVVGDVSGTGLSNYDITTVNGVFTVDNIITPPTINPIPGGNSTVTNPPDTITISFPGSNSEAGSVQESGSGTGGPQQSLGDAQSVFAIVDSASTDLEAAIKSCGSADQDFTNYMACLSESLDTYSNALDQIADDMPSGLESVSATIRTARDGVNAAAARAERRLAGATSEAERRAIRRDAVTEARTAINQAQEEIRKAITLIRADDPEVAAVQRNTGARIVQAFDTVDSELARAVEL